MKKNNQNKGIELGPEFVRMFEQKVCEQIHGLLLQAGKDIPIETIASWTTQQKIEAEKWASMRVIRIGLDKAIQDLNNMESSDTPDFLD